MAIQRAPYPVVDPNVDHEQQLHEAAAAVNATKDLITKIKETIHKAQQHVANGEAAQQQHDESKVKSAQAAYDDLLATQAHGEAQFAEVEKAKSELDTLRFFLDYQALRIENARLTIKVAQHQLAHEQDELARLKRELASLIDLVMRTRAEPLMETYRRAGQEFAAAWAGLVRTNEFLEKLAARPSGILIDRNTAPDIVLPGIIQGFNRIDQHAMDAHGVLGNGSAAIRNMLADEFNIEP